METMMSRAATPPTPEQPEGPFYPDKKPSDQDADLTVIAGQTGKAQGQVIRVAGRLMDTAGQPLPGARIEIWQANTFGRYITSKDQSASPLDPNFQGYGVQTTGPDGGYWFLTVKPAAYRVSQDWTRPPHIHFIVTHHQNRFITQLYFEGEPLNEKDLLFKDTPNKELLLTTLMPATKDVGPGTLIAAWDIVLRQTASTVKNK